MIEKFNKAKLPGAKVHTGKNKKEALRKAHDEVRSVLEQQHIALTQQLNDQKRMRRL